MRTKSLIASSLTAVTLVAASAVSAQAASPSVPPLQRVSALTQPGIVYLETTFEAKAYDPGTHAEIGSGRVFSTTYSCTGFFVTPQAEIASAGHCVNYDDEAKMDLLIAAADWSYEHEGWSAGITQKQAEEIAVDTWQVRAPGYLGGSQPERTVKAAYGVQISGLPTGKSLPARVLGSRRFENGDVSLLKIDAPGDVPALPLAPGAGKVDVGAPIVTIGYPGSVDLATDRTFDPSFKDGAISSKKTVDGGRRNVLEISAALSQGMSGGPTVDMRGRVIGINSFMPTGESQSFNFISPVQELKELMRDKGVIPARSQEDRLYAAGLTAFFAGNREKALASFDAVLSRDAHHQLAQAYRARAFKLAAAPKQSSGIPIGLIGAALALLLAAITAALMISRKVAAAKETPAQADATPVQAATPKPVVTPERAVEADATVIRAVPTLCEDVALHITSGLRADELVEVGRELSIGRGDDVDLRLDEGEVSRRHALIEPTADGPKLTDLGSSNGTFVNDEQITTPVTLRDGDVVAIGSSSMEVKVGRSARRGDVTQVGGAV